MNPQILAQENVTFAASAGVSDGNRHLNFRPAFRNRETGHIYPSRFADGRPAPIHIIDGLPEDVVLTRSAYGKVTSVKSSIQSGFTLDGTFFDREEALRYAKAQAAPTACKGISS